LRWLMCVNFVKNNKVYGLMGYWYNLG